MQSFLWSLLEVCSVCSLSSQLSKMEQGTAVLNRMYTDSIQVIHFFIITKIDKLKMMEVTFSYRKQHTVISKYLKPGGADKVQPRKFLFLIKEEPLFADTEFTSPL